MFLQYKFPIEPTRAQHARLASILQLQRNLYNDALQNRRAAFQRGVHLTYEDDTKSLPAYRMANRQHTALPWGINNWTLRCVDTAMTWYRDRLTANPNAGFPRFRSEERWRSFGVHGVRGCVVADGYLSVDGIVGKLRMRMHRPLPADARLARLTFTRRARQWHVAILIDCKVGDQEHKKPGSACGLDLGIEQLASLSDGSLFDDTPRKTTQSSALRRAYRALARCQKDSRRSKKLRERQDRASQRVINLRSTRLHQISAAITNRFETIVVEDLALKQFPRPTRTRRPSDGVGAIAIRENGQVLAEPRPKRLLEMIRYKAEKAGGKVVVVDPRHITQTCNACGSPTSESNDADRHICACGADVPRGTNNAINILARGLSAHAAALGRRVGKVLPNASV